MGHVDLRKRQEETVALGVLAWWIALTYLFEDGLWAILDREA